MQQTPAFLQQTPANALQHRLLQRDGRNKWLDNHMEKT